MKHQEGRLMKLPDGSKIKSFLRYCQVRGTLAGVGFTSGLFFRQEDDIKKILSYEVYC